MTSPRASRAKTSVGAIILGALASTAASVSAQDRGDEAVFVDLGRWTIVERPQSQSCELRLNSGAVDNLVFIKSRSRPGSLRLRGRNSGGAFMQGPITFAFDDTQFGGLVLRQGFYGPSSDSTAIEQEFRKARTLTVRHGERMIAQLSLKSSSAGFRLLNQCANQWQWVNGFTRSSTETVAARPKERPVAATSVPQTRPTPPVQQTATGPFPPNRKLQAINPGQWVRQEDFRRLPDLRGGDGNLRFTLLVNRDGRVEECAVDASSGSRDVDAKTCRAIQKRARFQPATDANGDPKEARFSSNVRFAPGE